MNKFYEQDNVAFIPLYRMYERARKRLILEWKNPLLKMSPEEFARAKYALAVALKARPTDSESRLKWELLREVENG